MVNKWLFPTGTDVNTVDKTGLTPLAWAAAHRQVSMSFLSVIYPSDTFLVIWSEPNCSLCSSNHPAFSKTWADQIILCMAHFNNMQIPKVYCWKTKMFAITFSIGVELPKIDWVQISHNFSLKVTVMTSFPQIIMSIFFKNLLITYKALNNLAPLFWY